MRRSIRWSWWSICCLVGTAAGHAVEWCEPPPEAVEQLEGLDLYKKLECWPREPCWQAAVDAAGSLAADYPNNVAVHRIYQNLVNRSRLDNGQEQHNAMVDAYRARFESNPDDPVAIYLYARQAPPDERAGLAERALDLVPNFPWSHLLLAGVTNPPLEQSLSPEDQLATFLELCPTGFEAAIVASRRVGGKDFWRPRIPALRAAMSTPDLATNSGYLEALWEIEFRISPPDRHDAVRAHVRSDLESLEAAPIESESFWRVVESGYEMIGDKEGRERARQALAAIDPCGRTAVDAAYQEWYAERNLDRMVTPSRMEQPVIRDLAAFADQWLTKCPNELTSSLLRFSSVVALETLTDNALLEAVDRLVASWEHNKDQVRMFQSPYYQAAEALLRRGIAFDRALELIEAEDELTGDLFDLESTAALPEQIRGNIILNRYLKELDIRNRRIEAFMGLSQYDKAADALAGVDEILPLVEAAAAAEQSEGSMARHRAEIWWLYAKLATARAQPNQEVQAFVRKSVQSSPDRENLARNRKLWMATDGHKEEWTRLEAAAKPTPDQAIVSTADAEGWKSSDEQLPAFELVDLDGKTWQPSDFLGKTVLVNLWATWCAPCRAEMPYLKSLAAAIDSNQELRDKVEIITFNLDRNPGLIAPFVNEYELEMPVLLASEYLERIEKGYSIPQNWILDGAGVIRYTQTGFTSSAGDQWIESALRLLER